MVYRTTLSPMFTLRREVDRLFDDAFGRAAAAPSTWSPVTDVREDAAGYTFQIELPGIAPEQVEVSLEQNVLTVRGEKQADVESASPKWHVAERVRGSFKRTFQLPQTVDAERISAKFSNGLLTVTVPVAAPKAKRIEVAQG